MTNVWIGVIYSECVSSKSAVLGNSVWQDHTRILKQVNQSLSSVEIIQLHSQPV